MGPVRTGVGAAGRRVGDPGPAVGSPVPVRASHRTDVAGGDESGAATRSVGGPIPSSHRGRHHDRTSTH
ncbi:hypothetical protein Ae505Ps2_4050 [Pseudonocardia sp. Ae505_Ps2]|nr:hypothetical protein Ae505Ps2_4050 [Pseudonocardia sp. Ae505_Ps2]